MPARPFTFDIPDFAGALNESASTNIQDRELAVFENLYVNGTSAHSRHGMTELAGPYTEKITDIFRYKPGYEEEEYIILGCAGSLARVRSPSIEALQVSDGQIYPTLSARWWAEQYNDEMFFCRRGNGGVKRVYGDSVCDAGIPAPSVAPVAVDGGPGKKEAGEYQLAYRFKNLLTGAVSNWSPWSNSVTLADLGKIALSGVLTSQHPQVNAREVGATRLSNGVMYVVGQINDNVNTTYTDNASDVEYGEADVEADGVTPRSDYRHGVPPEQAWSLAFYKERLWILNKEGIYASEPGYPQSFPGIFIPVQKGTGLLSWQDHGLVIVTETNAQILRGDTAADWSTDAGNLSKEHGCPAPKSMVVADGILYYYTGVNIVRTDGGAPVILPGQDRVQETLEDIPESGKGDVFASTIPGWGWVVFTVPQSDGTQKQIVYDYRENVFQVFTEDASLYAMARMGQANQAEAVFVADYDPEYGDAFLYEFLSGLDDAGAPIVVKWRTKGFGWDRGISDKVTRFVGLLTNQVPGSLTLKVYHDDTLAYTRTGLSLNKKGWKQFVVDTHGTPGAIVSVQCEFEPSSATQLRVDQMRIVGVNIQRGVVPS